MFSGSFSCHAMMKRSITLRVILAPLYFLYILYTYISYIPYIPYIPPISLLFCFRLIRQSSYRELLFMLTGSPDEHVDVVAGWWLSRNEIYSTYLCFCIFGFLAFTFVYFLVSPMSQLVGGWVVDKQKIIDLTNQPGGAPFNGTRRSQLVKWSK